VYEFPFSESLPACAIFCLFDISHSNWDEIISHCGFDLHFPDSKVKLFFKKIYFLTIYVFSWLVKFLLRELVLV
jgi:hypothetical protein